VLLSALSASVSGCSERRALPAKQGAQRGQSEFDATLLSRKSRALGPIAAADHAASRASGEEEDGDPTADLACFGTGAVLREAGRPTVSVPRPRRCHRDHARVLYVLRRPLKMGTDGAQHG
jgi:hypothetical protein